MHCFHPMDPECIKFCNCLPTFLIANSAAKVPSCTVFTFEITGTLDRWCSRVRAIPFSLTTKKNQTTSLVMGQIARFLFLVRGRTHYCALHHCTRIACCRVSYLLLYCTVCSNGYIVVIAAVTQLQNRDVFVEATVNDAQITQY